MQYEINILGLKIIPKAIRLKWMKKYYLCFVMNKSKIKYNYVLLF